MTSPPPTVLLTGATGFIGCHVLQAMVDAGFRVVALVRRGSNDAFVRSLAAEVRYGDIRDPPSLRAALEGCSVAVHTAGRVSDWGSYAEFYQTNVEGTLNVLEACRLEQVRDVVITGSVSSYGEENSDHLKDENSPTGSHYRYFLDSIFPSALNFYRDTKRLCTEKAMDFARTHALNLTVIEPAWTFGEHETGTGFYAYVKAVRDGMRWMPGNASNWFHVVYAADLARAYLLVCQKRPVGVEKYIVGYPESHLMTTIFGLFFREAALKPPRLLPKWALYPPALGLEGLWTLVRAHHPPPLTRGRVCTFYDSIRYSTRKARAVLGFECQYPLEQAVRRTVAWYKANHYL